MRVLKNWKDKYKFKLKAKVRKQLRKELEDKFSKGILEKDNEINNLHEHYKREIERVRIQEANKWKALLNERDDEIRYLREDKERRREAINKFEKMVQDFENMYTTTRIEIQAAGEYQKKADQKLLKGSFEWDSFTKNYKKIFPKVQDRLMEE